MKEEKLLIYRKLTIKNKYTIYESLYVIKGHADNKNPKLIVVAPLT